MFIASGGFDLANAEVRNAPDASTFHTPGAKGYTVYPVADVPERAPVG